MEINGQGIEKQKQINKTKSLFFEKINTMPSP
jgi:hypothetical protein